MKSLLIEILGALLLVPVLTSGGEFSELAPDATSTVRKRVEKVASEAAKLGLPEIVERCMVEVEALGANERGLEQLNKRIEKALAKSKGEPSRKSLERLAGTAQSAARSVAVLANGMDEGDRKAELYQMALRLDSQLGEAHEGLGHIEGEDGIWRSNREKALVERQHEIAVALQHALSLEPEVEIVEATDVTLIQMYSGEVSAVEVDGLRVESPVSEERLAEMMRASMRAMAFAQWLQSGDFEPEHETGVVVHLLGQPAYKKYLQTAINAGEIDLKDGEEYLKFGGFWRRTKKTRKPILTCYRSIADMGGVLVHYFDQSLRKLSDDDSFDDSITPHWMKVGHSNYVALKVLGVSIPDMAAREKDDRSSSERKSEYRLQSAGLVGCRSWLILLTKEGRVPSLARCVVDQVPKVRGDLLLRATASVEYLHERGEMADMAERCYELWREHPDGTISFLERTELTLGRPISEFDPEWERWLLSGGGADSVCDRVRALAGPRDVAADTMLTVLNERRAAAGLDLVELDVTLSLGAQKHAAYLNVHPEQKSQWPGAHEEYPESEGFTPEGAWAGSHSVIAFSGPDAAIDDWLATFYHRVPLTHPGLLRIGAGAAAETCVLDSNSLTDPTGGYESHYPYKDQQEVPLRFLPENPNPVPVRRDQSTLGYPITYQLGPNWGASEVVMTLWLGAEEVPCFYSTPSNPTNPELSPAGVYCLMPKDPLQPGSSYLVKIDGPGNIDSFQFRTSK